MKKNILFLFVIIIANTLFSQSLNDGLLIYYPFSGNMQDHSGNKYNGQGNATLTTDRFGNINKAYSFNGVDQYIDLPFTNELKPKLPVTFSFWVKLENLDPSNGVFFTTDWDSDNHCGCWMGLSSTHCVSLNFGDGSGPVSSSRNSKIGSTIFQANSWHHITGVIRGFNDMDIYIDCINIGGSYYGSGGSLEYSNTQGSIGRKDANDATIPSYYMWGSMDEFCYWDRALSEDEIIQLCTENPIVQDRPFDAYLCPNPCIDQIHIFTSRKIGIARVNIYNSIGQIVYNQGYSKYIDVGDLSAGLYAIRLIDKDNTILKTLKFVKMY